MAFVSSVLAITFIALVTDLLARRIPNALTITALAVGLAAQVVVFGGYGLGMALLGVVVGAGLTIVPFALGAMGAGDVKLMAALGAFLGPLGILVVGVLASVAAGAVAVCMAARRRQLGRALAGAPNAIAGGAPASIGSLPYAVPVAIAVFVGLPILTRLPI